MKIFSIVFFSLFVIACKSQRVVEAIAKNNIDSVIISESACEGTCPVYTMTIFSDGTSIYKGEQHTNKLGNHDYTFSKEVVERLFKDLNAIDFKTFEAGESFITDMPETKIIYKNNTIVVKDIRSISEPFKELVTYLKKLTRSSGLINK